ncbi:hypothetical protein NliqN6_3576 [Naganishia liquefaciens]|uniref:RRM domain-containing protein n=1 Tax=Naganishia liquefaciens TaxID=104408 RepID=A0A8H3YF35_9TREE|nr:hypothetical protein NliqN6_3576 [Naganishia liquefaciens]
MAYNDPYGGPPPPPPPPNYIPTYQTDSSIMRPANLPPLSFQTAPGFRGGPDRNAPRRGGYRSSAGGQQARAGGAGRPPRGGGANGFQGGGGGGRGEFDDRGAANPGWGAHNPGGGGPGFSGGGGGMNGAGYDDGGAWGGASGSGPFVRNQGFAPPPRNEFDGYDNSNLSRFNDRGGPAPFPARREKPVDVRVQHERPCRTLFVRNVNYGADSQQIRANFERYGEIKTFFDIIATRGMAFITYFDLRGAEQAREGMHNSLVNGRPIDVHFSLPKAEEVSGECTREKNQGALELRLKSGRPITNEDVQRAFSMYGQIKDIRNGPSPDKKIVEYFDARAAVDAFDALGGRPFLDSEMQVRFIWDFPDIARSGVPAGAGRSRGGRGRGRGDRADERDRSPDHGYSRPAPYSSGASLKRGEDSATMMSVPSANKAPSERLDEAKKIQDLLASLSQTQNNAPKPPAPAPTPQAQYPIPPNVTSASAGPPANAPSFNAYTPSAAQQYPYPSAYVYPGANAYTPAAAASPVAPPTPANPMYNNSPAAPQPPRQDGVPGLGRYPLPVQPTAYSPTAPTNGVPPSAPPANAPTPVAPAYPYPSAAPTAMPVTAPIIPTAPSVAPGMSDLLALLAAQQKKQ